jgi:hypothetical protein
VAKRGWEAIDRLIKIITKDKVCESGG